MREFNTFGPVDPRLHYHVDRVAVKAAMRQKIEKGRYFTLNAARQAGKTTLFQEVVAELERSGPYLGVLLECNGLALDAPELIYRRISRRLQDTLQRVRTADPQSELARYTETQTVANHHDLGDYVRDLGRLSGKSVLLIIDEFDALPEPVLVPLLGVFRSLYHHRLEPAYDAPKSVILVGVHNIQTLLGGTQSPFNIADQFSVPYFTADEVRDLLTQHTAETGQPFAEEVIAGIAGETGGQPFLVNRLGQVLTQDLVPDRTRTITPLDLQHGVARLLSENNTHFSSILSRAMKYRDSLLPLVFYDERRSNFLDPMTQELIMYGVLRVVEENPWTQSALIANPIYRKMLALRFATPPEQMPISGPAVHRHVHRGVLDSATTASSTGSLPERS